MDNKSSTISVESSLNQNGAEVAMEIKIGQSKNKLDGIDTIDNPPTYNGATAPTTKDFDERPDPQLMDPEDIAKEMKNIYKNILLISFCFLLNFNAFQVS